MKIKSKEQGFTLIELLLVVVIIGILLAVIVPRAWRANIDAKYGLVRQNASELASFAQQWAEEQIEASIPDTSDSTITDYFNTLSFPGAGGGGGSQGWIAFDGGGSNWTGDGKDVDGRDPETAETAVHDIIPPERIPRNPFNGASVFSVANLPDETPIPGALLLARAEDGSFYHYGFLFQGTDSTSITRTETGTFHAGQSAEDEDDLAGVRNGVFAARYAQ